MRKGLGIFLIILISSVLGGLLGSYLASGNFVKMPWSNVSGGIQQVFNKTTLREEESEVISAVNKVSPAVVSIEIQKDISKNSSVNLFDDFFSNWPFFDNTQPVPNKNTEPDWQKVGGGTGFIISADGLILTNRHVISDADAKYKVVLNNGDSYDAAIVGTDLFNDLGFLRIKADKLPVVEFGDSDKAVIGQTVVAIGNALAEFSNTVTVGVVSGKGRSIVAGVGGSSEKLANVIQTDAAINPGNSGGPLLNLDGQVIGINTAISSQGQSIGFAIPINVAKPLIESVKKTGEIVRPYLGVRYVMLTEELAKQKKLDIKAGALLSAGTSSDDTAIVEDSPASKAGLKEGDVIVEVNGKKLNQDYDLAQAISQFQPGNQVKLKVFSDGQNKDITVTLEKYKK